MISAASTEINSSGSEHRARLPLSGIPIDAFTCLAAMVPYLERDVGSIDWIKGNGLKYNCWIAEKQIDGIQNKNGTLWTISPDIYDELMSVVVSQSHDECKFISKNTFLQVLKVHNLIHCTSGRYTIRRGLNRKPLIAIKRAAVLQLIDEQRKSQEMTLRSVNPSPLSINESAVARDVVDTRRDVSLAENVEQKLNVAGDVKQDININDEADQEIADNGEEHDSESDNSSAQLAVNPRKRGREDIENHNTANIPIIEDDVDDIEMQHLSLSPPEPPRKRRKR